MTGMSLTGFFEEIRDKSAMPWRYPPRTRPIALRPRSALLAALIGCLPLIPTASGRTWTDVMGRKLEGTLIAADEKEIVLRLGNGRNVTIPLDRLSPEDREYIGNWSPGDGEEDKDGTGEDRKNPGDEGEALNFDDPWPDKIRFVDDPGIEIVEEDKDGKRFVYESAHYRFICDVRLSMSVVKGFSVMFEATHIYCRALPIALSGGVMRDGKYEILLFEKKEDYVKAGGPPSSAGVFIGGRNVVMVPLTSLGVRPVGSGYMLDRDKANGTLIHEITHQLTPGPYFNVGARGWFSEGIAEYLTATPYRSGAFKVKSNFDDIVAYATAYGKDDRRGRALGTKIDAPALRDFMLMSYDAFTGPRANFNYGFGLLLTTYFLHLDGEGDGARMKEFLKALRAGKRGEDAIAPLLDGRSFRELEEDVAKAWKRKRVEIFFAEPAGGEDGY